MEIRVNVVLFDNDVLLEMTHPVDNDNYKIIRRRLEIEKVNIINRLKELKVQGAINSIYKPANSGMQKDLDKLVRCKRTLNASIEKIKMIYK